MQEGLITELQPGGVGWRFYIVALSDFAPDELAK